MKLLRESVDASDELLESFPTATPASGSTYPSQLVVVTTHL